MHTGARGSRAAQTPRGGGPPDSLAGVRGAGGAFFVQWRRSMRRERERREAAAPSLSFSWRIGRGRRTGHLIFSFFFGASAGFRPRVHTLGEMDGCA